jgi:hypothetical protein
MRQFGVLINLGRAILNAEACQTRDIHLTNDGYFDFKHVKLCAHINISYILYKPCSVATPEHSEPLPPENYVRIVALSPDLWTVSIYSATEFLHHSSTIELLSLLKLIKRVIPELWGLTTILEIVISLVAAVARKFMQDRHTGRYSKTGFVQALSSLKYFVPLSALILA